MQGEFEDKLAGEEEMASSDPVLPAQNSSSLATFSFVEPTRAATDSDDEQVNNVNQIKMGKSTRPFLVFNQLDIFIR